MVLQTVRYKGALLSSLSRIVTPLLCCGCFTSAAGGRRGGTTAFARWAGVLGRVLGLGLVVVLSFGAMWGPFCVFPGSDAGSGCLSSLGQASLVVKQRFPFVPGLQGGRRSPQLQQNRVP